MKTCRSGMLAVHSLLLMLMCLATSLLEAQNIKVLVLDAKNGEPQANALVEYYCIGRPNTGPIEAKTGGDGVTNFVIACRVGQKLAMSVSPADNKEQCGDGLIAIDEILSVGIVTNPESAGNIWCSAKFSKTVKPTAGQLILFVKKPTWYQSHVAG